MKYLIIFLWATSAFASSTPDLKKIYLDLLNKPTEKNLAQLKLKCAGDNSLDLESDNLNETTLKNTQNVTALRGILYAYKNCTDGGSAESLMIELGSNTLLKNPASLIEALAQEKDADKLASDLAVADNTTTFLTDCADKQNRPTCLKFFQNKIEVLKNTKLEKKFQPLRDQMVLSIENHIKAFDRK
ncbi:MAG: hypothetical protein WCG27_02935 [Pseudomonadota bacterium]